MAWWGKIVGGTFGFMLGGPIGAVFGAAFGHNFDKGVAQNYSTMAGGSPNQEHIQAAFFYCDVLGDGPYRQSRRTRQQR